MPLRFDGTFEREGPARSVRHGYRSYRITESTMKPLAKVALICCALNAPLFAQAQTVSGTLTRTEVRAELLRVENAGYRPIAR
ncbi:DUF4148 domain-containing protein [Paraburkholderia sp. NMBU_R16]|uniref:DUF4148 domain-containing protein n=1 Tax=Paraburkholderia sp. NMBU_R16 TaxID=2698676 RepID=UPI00349F7A43